MFSVGDVVVCVRDNPCPHYRTTTRVQKGAIYRIVEACLFTDKSTGFQAFAVLLDRDNPVKDGIEGWSHHDRFRKITAADEQFTAQIRACRPAHRKSPVSA